MTRVAIASGSPVEATMWRTSSSSVMSSSVMVAFDHAQIPARPSPITPPVSRLWQIPARKRAQKAAKSLISRFGCMGAEAALDAEDPPGRQRHGPRDDEEADDREADGVQVKTGDPGPERPAEAELLRRQRGELDGPDHQGHHDREPG